MKATVFSNILELTSDFLFAKEENCGIRLLRGTELLEAFLETKERFRNQDDVCINLLELSNPDENANSRILGRLFQMKHGTQFEILQSFVDVFYGESFFGEIKYPEILLEWNRIDILVREQSYAIILENKIWKAEQQHNQLARYIKALREDGYQDEQIYIVYLSPTIDYQPYLCNWMTESESLCRECKNNINCRRKDEESNLFPLFEQRYRIVPFDSGILPWLRDKICPACRESDVMLKMALIQYVEFLESKFGTRINNKFKMEVETMIRERLNLTGDSFSNFDKVADKIRDINELLKYLKGMQDGFETDAFKSIEKSLMEQYPDYYIDSKTEGIYHFLFIHLFSEKENIGIRVFATYDSSRKNQLYYGIRTEEGYGKEMKQRISNMVKKTVNHIKGFVSGTEWVYYRETTLSELEHNMIELISELQRDILVI